jgi:DNA-binding HxlR family transcriptional regulator
MHDMTFGDRRHYRELLSKSEEGISSNILADRLKILVDRGIMTKVDDPTHKHKAIYSLTEQGIALLPILAPMGAWGAGMEALRGDVDEFLARGDLELDVPIAGRHYQIH